MFTNHPLLLAGEQEFEYSAPVLCQEGNVVGKLQLSLARVGDMPIEVEGSHEEMRNIAVRLKVKSVLGLPPSLARVERLLQTHIFIGQEI